MSGLKDSNLSGMEHLDKRDLSESPLQYQEEELSPLEVTSRELAILDSEIQKTAKLIEYFNAAYWLVFDIEQLSTTAEFTDPKDYSFLTLRLFLRNLEGSDDFFDVIKSGDRDKIKENLKQRLIREKVRSINQTQLDDAMSVYSTKTGREMAKLEDLKAKRTALSDSQLAKGSVIESSRKVVDSTAVLTIIVGVLLVLCTYHVLRDKNTKGDIIELVEEFKEKILTNLSW